jgi:hypothetical protein
MIKLKQCGILLNLTLRGTVGKTEDIFCLGSGNDKSYDYQYISDSKIMIKIL